MVAMTEEKMIEMTLEERSKFLSDIRVLDRVKELILLPNTELMTTRMVAEWFEVTEEVIRDNIRRNRTELESSGVKAMKHIDIKALVNSELFSQLKISGNGASVFSKRALLNMAMLLRDSPVARRVRVALLDQQEHLTVEQKVSGIDKEKELAMNIMFADSEGEKMLAFHTYNSYKNRHIEQLEATIEEQRPSVEMVNDVMDSKGSHEIINVCKSFGIGRSKFATFLRSAEIFFMREGHNVPKQELQNQGYFDVVMKPYLSSDGDRRMSYKTTITGKGKKYLHRVFQKYGGAESINNLRMTEIDNHVQAVDKEIRMSKRQ